MLFFPYKVDLDLRRIPFLTIMVCVLCIAIFLMQLKSNYEINAAAEQYCKKNQQQIFRLATKKVAGITGVEACAKILFSIHSSNSAEKRILELSENSKEFNNLSFAEGNALITKVLGEHYHQFADTVPESLTASLMYDPSSYNVKNMITAAFAHGGWMHLLGNLFFFFAFAASVEIVLGSFAYIGIIVLLAIGTHLAYSLAMFTAPIAVPTLGLSGVVMGMIGVFTFLMPTARIRCFLWYIIIIRILSIPAWILALWFIGVDVYQLYSNGNTGGVNLIAHVSGAIIGFLSGVLLFRKKRPNLRTRKRVRRA